MKKVFIGVLAALMLFAFTACDNGSTTYGVITKIEASTSAEYVSYPGMKIDPADFTFTGYTSTGDAVTIPSDQFEVSAKDSGALVGEDTYAVAFDWGSTGMKATGSVKIYAIEKMEVAAGTAQVKYYTFTPSTNGYADSTQKDADFTAIKPEGVVITFTYDTDKTVAVTVNSDNAKYYEFAFGKVSNGTFNADGTDGSTVPTTAGAYAIQVSLGEFDDTYDVTVETNRVKATSIAVADNYALYATGTAAVTLDAAKVYVTTEMSNGQLLKAASADVKWATTADGVDAASATSVVSSLAFSKEPSTFEVFAKFVGGPCETGYTRSVMSKQFTSNAVEITGYEVSGYNATLKLPEDPEKPYNDTDNKVKSEDVNGIEVVAKYNNNTKATAQFGEPAVDTIHYNIATPSVAGKVEKDSIVITVNIYNGTQLVQQTPVTVTLVK